jgi:hypothetical protein
MKTDKFEKTIRQKLESISPDFHEDNWAKMQNYMQVHTPPTFWQQYGSWLGYAAAASVTSVMAFLYVNQLSQNNDLVADVTKLKNQIELINSSPTVIQRVDTIYVVQKEVSKEQYRKQHSQDFATNISQSGITETGENIFSENNPKAGQNESTTNNSLLAQKNKNPYKQGSSANEASNDISEISRTPEAVSQEQLAVNSESVDNTGPGSVFPSAGLTKRLDDSFADVKEISPSSLSESNSRSMHYALANRLSPRQTRKLWLANAVNTVKSAELEDKKVEKTTKAENIIPQLNIRAPYRFGAGYQFEGSNQVKSIVGEVLVAKKFSIASGISWLKVKPMEFFSEKMFKEKNKKDFRKEHPGQVPMAFEVANIAVKPTLIQIPLTVAFRNDITSDFSYYVGAGTNITIKGKEKISFDSRFPKYGQEFQTQSFERKMDVPLFNSMNINAGIEKTWHPIVVQIEGYLFTYFKPLTPENQRTGPGVKMKLLYQIGKKM